MNDKTPLEARREFQHLLRTGQYAKTLTDPQKKALIFMYNATKGFYRDYDYIPTAAKIASKSVMEALERRGLVEVIRDDEYEVADGYRLTEKGDGIAYQLARPE